MKISTKGRYGLQAMVDLAINYGKDRIPLKDIAKRQKISDAYLEQIFSTLRKGGLVKSIKGPQGGYSLIDPPSEITVGKILKVMEGELFVYDEVSKEDKIGKVITDNVWFNINKQLNDVVESITLEYLVQEYQKNNDDNYMFYI